MPKLRKVRHQEHHRDFMSTWNEGGVSIEPPPEHVFELMIAGTVLVFVDEKQVREACHFFGEKMRPSGRGGNPPFEHYWHPWFARLPKDVLKRTNREKIWRALRNGIAEYFDQAVDK